MGRWAFAIRWAYQDSVGADLCGARWTVEDAALGSARATQAARGTVHARLHLAVYRSAIDVAAGPRATHRAGVGVSAAGEVRGADVDGNQTAVGRGAAIDVATFGAGAVDGAVVRSARTDEARAPAVFAFEVAIGGGLAAHVARRVLAAAGVAVVLSVAAKKGALTTAGIAGERAWVLRAVSATFARSTHRRMPADTLGRDTNLAARSLAREIAEIGPTAQIPNGERQATRSTRKDEARCLPATHVRILAAHSPEILFRRRSSKALSGFVGADARARFVCARARSRSPRLR